MPSPSSVERSTWSSNARNVPATTVVDEAVGLIAAPGPEAAGNDRCDASSAFSCWCRQCRILDHGLSRGGLRTLPSVVHAFAMISSGALRSTEDPTPGRSSSSISGTIAYITAAPPQPAIARKVRRPHASLGPFDLLRLAQLAAIQGRYADCCERVDRAVTMAPAVRHSPALPARGAWILGLLELGLGRIEAAIGRFEQCAELMAGSVGDREDVPTFEADLVEALIARGRIRDAHQVADSLELRAASSRAQAALVAAARCRTMLAPPDRLQREFEAALELYERMDGEFERARTELCYGQRLRREHRRREARRHLSSALVCFEQLGAAPWAERAQHELLATCPTQRSRSDYAASDRLTPQECRVVQIIAGGATVRQAAAQLFLSSKTIEAHLGRAYRKLNVRNRAQLVTAVRHREASGLGGG
jgi:DNA-binding CsgD family transcriptional regulator